MGGYEGRGEGREEAWVGNSGGKDSRRLHRCKCEHRAVAVDSGVRQRRRPRHNTLRSYTTTCESIVSLNARFRQTLPPAEHIYIAQKSANAPLERKGTTHEKPWN